MNPIFVTSTIIMLIIACGLLIATVVNLKKDIKHYKELVKQQDGDRQDLRNLVKTVRQTQTSIEKQRDITMALIKRLLAHIINKHRANLINDLFPFEYAATVENSLNPLNSIRFKRIEDKGLVYINGAMVPTNSLIQVTNYTCLDKEDLTLYKQVLENLEAIDKKEKTVDNLELFLK